MTVTAAARNPKYHRSTIDDITINNIGQLQVILESCKLLDSLVDSSAADATNVFLKAAQESCAKDDISKLVFFMDLPVGAIIAQREKSPSGPCHEISVVALAVLKAYQNLGLEAKLLEHVKEVAQKEIESDAYATSTSNSKKDKKDDKAVLGALQGIKVGLTAVGGQADSLKEVFQEAGFKLSGGAYIWRP